ncbi:hypothetical protein ACWDRR_10845 [Kitasatospora sp. NPDC003701]
MEQQIQQTAEHGVITAHLRDFPVAAPEGWLFTAPTSGPVVYTYFMHGSWQSACQRAGIPKGTGPHALRHR